MNRHDEMLAQVKEFHVKNPKVWTLFSTFTFEMIDRGFKHYSVNGIFERIRWETDQAPTNGGKSFKIGNNFRPFYSRAFMRKNPEHDGFFRTRKQKSKECPALGFAEIGPNDLGEQL